MKTYTIFILLLFFSINTFAQSIKKIRESGEYIYGVGESDAYEKADQMALNDLISQISVRVESSFEMIRSDENDDYKEFAKSIVKTYSSTTLTNVLKVDEEKDGIYRVVRYLPKKDLNQVFIKRKKAIVDYVKEGIKAENKLLISDALRDFYWAYILLRSHPDYDKLQFEAETDSVLLRVYLPNKINEIFSKIKVEVAEQIYNPDEKFAKYLLAMKYGGNLIESIDYRFKYETSWSSTINSSNGNALLEFYGDDAQKDKDIRIRIEYMYKNKALFDKDVQSIYSSDIELPYFNTCELATQLNKFKNQDKKETIVELLNNPDPELLNEFQNILKSIEQKKDINPNEFTKDGLLAYYQLIKYGDARLLKTDIEIRSIKINDNLMVRSIPMQFKFSENKEFTEDVVFILNKEGKIDDINFSLSKTAINDILSKKDAFATDEVKYFLIHFLEGYKTAYCLKRIDYLQNIFDEDALIIVGKVVKRTNSADDPYYNGLSDKEVTYQRFSKEQYITNLKRIFDRNEFVNIHFEDNVVKKAQKDMDIFGIQIAQHYTSESYADKGYLFLMVDLRDTLNPIIHVRTWQPQKNDDGSIYGLADFPFEKL